MFDRSLPDANEWSVRAVLAWIDGDALIHRSGTLMGGPYGFKWALLVLLFLFTCGRKIQAGHGPRYGAIIPEWLDSDTRHVVDVAKCLLLKVAESVTELSSSKAARVAARRHQELNGRSSPSWDYAEADVSFMGTPGDEWTRNNLIVTKYPSGRGVTRNQQRTPSHKRSRDGMRGDAESERDESGNEGPP
ncbi:hypothetical protein FS749_005936 [Ceratobasidium sp. UAMH 11750]|nr:hypothetical protein FS749_005936 [Ceratobasidium sp. UAMH 11750]